VLSLPCQYHATRRKFQLRRHRRLSRSCEVRIWEETSVPRRRRKKCAQSKSRSDQSATVHNVRHYSLCSQGVRRKQLSTTAAAHGLSSSVAAHLRRSVEAHRVHRHPTFNRHVYGSKSPCLPSCRHRYRSAHASPTWAAQTGPSSPPDQHPSSAPSSGKS
jgi:hypothetical protein